MRVFLGAHGPRLAAPTIGRRVEQHCGLLYLATVLDQVDLPLDLAVDGLLQELETVQVLDLAPGAVRHAGLSHRHIGVAAEAAFLHVAVADAQPHHQRVQRFRVFGRFGAGAHVGLGDDLQQRCAGAVQVNAGLAGVILVERFAGIFLEVGAGEAHLVSGVSEDELDRAALHHRSFILADLVPLGQIGVEVVLARKDRVLCDLGADGQTELDRPFDRAAVHHRQRAWQRQIDRRSLRVGCGTELS